MFKTFSENRAVYEKMWKKIVQPDRPQMTVWPMRIASWIPKATNTHLDYVILFLFQRKSGYKHSSLCYVIRTLPFLFLFHFFHFCIAIYFSRINFSLYVHLPIRSICFSFYLSLLRSVFLNFCETAAQ